MARLAFPLPRAAGHRLAGALLLMRPANALTAAADTLAGIALAWGLADGELRSGLWLLPPAAALLYAGGVALNDVCDFAADRRQRPGRPLPRGLLSRQLALFLSGLLLAAGVLLAAAFDWRSGWLAGALVLVIVTYDAVCKPQPWVGPLAMGMCRAGSLLLGLSANSVALVGAWPLAAIPLAYVAAITAVGRGECDGRNPHGGTALAVIALVATALAALALARGEWPALIVVALFAALVWPPFLTARLAPSPETVRGAVKAGALNLVVCDAAFAAAFAGPAAAAAILLLLPLSRVLARRFPVA